MYRPNIIKTCDITPARKDSGLYTNLFDEWRTNEYIDVENITGISIPVNSLMVDDMNYLLFNSIICNILCGEADTDFKITRYDKTKRSYF